jgi:hypothetical protein
MQASEDSCEFLPLIKQYFPMTFLKPISSALIDGFVMDVVRVVAALL